MSCKFHYESLQQLLFKHCNPNPLRSPVTQLTQWQACRNWPCPLSCSLYEEQGLVLALPLRSHAKTVGKDLKGFGSGSHQEVFYTRSITKLSLINKHCGTPEGIQVDIWLYTECKWINEQPEQEYRKTVENLYGKMFTSMATHQDSWLHVILMH